MKIRTLIFDAKRWEQVNHFKDLLALLLMRNMLTSCKVISPARWDPVAEGIQLSFQWIKSLEPKPCLVLTVADCL